MNYSEMSDTEVNIQVCKALGKVISSYCRIRKVGDSSILLDDNETLFNPCNSWADAGQIIAENKISIHAPRLGERWLTEYTGSDDDVNDGFSVDYFEYHHQNPLRAAMIVFLMMKDEEAKNESH